MWFPLIFIVNKKFVNVFDVLSYFVCNFLATFWSLIFYFSFFRGNGGLGRPLQKLINQKWTIYVNFIRTFNYLIFLGNKEIVEFWRKPIMGVLWKGQNGDWKYNNDL